MKKLVVVILSALIMLTLLTACFGSPSGYAGARIVDSSETFIIIEATETGGSLEEALAELQTDNALTFDGSKSEYGYYLTEINGRVADASKGEYWAIYISFFDIPNPDGPFNSVPYSNADYGTYDYNGRTCASASYGVSGLPMVEGELYVIALETY